MSFLTTLLIFILVVSFLVFIHELGHFIAAKLVGIKVEEFSIGMGPKIFGFQHRDQGTLFSVRILPIGGYVKLYGEGDYDLIDEGSYAAKPPIARLFVLFAGVFMNFIFAVGYFYLQGFLIDFNYRSIDFVDSKSNAWFGKEYTDRLLVLDFLENSPLIGKVDRFDILVKVNDKEYTDIIDLQKILISNSEQEVKLTFVSYNSSNEKEIFVKIPKINKNLISSYNSPLVTIKTIKDDSPLKNKVQELDTILNLNQTEYQFTEFGKLIADSRGKTIEFLIYRDSTQEYFNVRIDVPNRDYPLGITYFPSVGLEYILGVGGRGISLIEFEGVSKIWSGFGHALNQIQLFLSAMQYLIELSFKSKTPAPLVDNVTGVVGIFHILDQMIALLGVWGILELLVIFSINLVIVNLLPIPALDGGHILFTFIELVSNRRLSTNLYNKITFFGFVFLLSLMLFITFLDLIRFTDLRNFVCNQNINIPFVCELKYYTNR